MPFLTRSMDVGYSAVKFVHAVDRSRILCRHFPSIAPLADDRQLTEALGRRRKTVQIEVSGTHYEVGPDANLAAGSLKIHNMDDDYCLTNEYLALARGALHYMQVERVDLLVVGLPLSTLVLHAEELERRLTGTHKVGSGHKTHVERVRVLAQPQGALMNYAVRAGKSQIVRKQRNLIIDCGARTFDWLVAQGLKIQDKRSGAVPRGMFDVLQVLCTGVAKQFGANFSNLESVDEALRHSRPARAFGSDVDLSPFLPAARKTAAEAVTAMRSRIGDASDIDNVIVAGGGAFFFGPLIQEALPHHRIALLEDEDGGIYANVKGFQHAGWALAVSSGLVKEDGFDAVEAR